MFLEMALMFRNLGFGETAPVESNLGLLVHPPSSFAALARGWRPPDFPSTSLKLAWSPTMPFPFSLPTTSQLNLSVCAATASHPSLPLTATSQRAALCSVLKHHKRLGAAAQTADLSNVLNALTAYLPYLFFIDGGLSRESASRSIESLDITLQREVLVSWRATLTGTLPGRDHPKLKLRGLESEIAFTVTTLAYTYILLARSSLAILYSQHTSPTNDQRTNAITTATRYLLQAQSAHSYLASRAEQWSQYQLPGAVDIAPGTLSALAELSLAEATLLAVLKDDPYPAVVAQDRNKNDKEWMIKAPELPKVRAHLFARLCLAAADHASRAEGLLAGAGKRIDEVLVEYTQDLRKVAKVKACRFFGIDAELTGKTGEAIGWLRAGKKELGIDIGDSGKQSKFGRLKKEWSERKEDKKIAKGEDWGLDAGRFEEGRILDMLEKKWMKMNDTINTQIISSPESLLSTMPSGREIHMPKSFEIPALDSETLARMRAPVESTDVHFEDDDSDEEGDGGLKSPVGAFPGTKSEYNAGSSYY